jgi:O-antigen ligase
VTVATTTGRRESLRIWSWRVGLLAFVVVATARAKAPIAGSADSILTATQFGIVIVLIAVVVVSRRSAPLRRHDVALLAALGAFVALQLATWPWSRDATVSGSQAVILLIMAAFLAVTYCFRWTEAAVVRLDLLFVYAVVCCLQLVGLTAFVLGADWATAGYGRFVGVFSNANFTGMISAFVLPLAVYLQRTVRARPGLLLWAGAAVLAITVVISLSRGALLASVAGLVVASVFLVRRLWFTVAAGVCGVVAGVGLTVALFAIRSTAVDTSLDEAAADPSSGRLDLAATLLDAWSTNPVFGIGYRASAAVTGGLEAHNIYLTVLVETGVLGAALFLALLAAVALAAPRRGMPAVLIGGAVAVAVAETTESSLFGWGAPSTVVAWIVVLALAASGRPGSRSEDRASRDAPGGV